jgi:uncharacterized protein YjbJ (UPF0337 family)
MNWDQIEGNWKVYRGKVKERWGKLTDDDLDVIAGKYDQLVGHVQKKYGMVRKDAENQIKNFMKSVSGSIGETKSRMQTVDPDEQRMDSDFGQDNKAS